MSSAGRAASSGGCVGRPRGRETGLTGYAGQIQRSSPIGSSAMETAEHREPYESRGSRTDLGAPGGESPPGDSTGRTVPVAKAEWPLWVVSRLDVACAQAQKTPWQACQGVGDRTLEIIGWVTPAQSRLPMQSRCMPKLGANAKTP